MAGECGGRSESRYMAPSFLSPTTCAMNLKSFMRLPKERPALDCAGLAIDRLEEQLEAPGGANIDDVRSAAKGRWLTVAMDKEKGRGKDVRRHRTLPPIAADLQAAVGRIVILDFSLEGLVLGALGANPRKSGPSTIWGLNDL